MQNYKLFFIPVYNGIKLFCVFAFFVRQNKNNGFIIPF